MLCWNFEFLIKFQLKTIKYSANLKVIWHILLYKCLHFFILYMQYFSGRKFMIQHNIYFYYKSLKVMPHFTVGNLQKKNLLRCDKSCLICPSPPLQFGHFTVYIWGSGTVLAPPPSLILFYCFHFLFGIPGMNEANCWIFTNVFVNVYIYTYIIYTFNMHISYKMCLSNTIFMK